MDPHKVASKSLLVGLEGPVILPPLKDRTALSLMVSDYVAYEIMVCPHYVEIMAQQFPEQPESEKQAVGVDIMRSVSLQSTAAVNRNKLFHVKLPSKVAVFNLKCVFNCQLIRCSVLRRSYKHRWKNLLCFNFILETFHVTLQISCN